MPRVQLILSMLLLSYYIGYGQKSLNIIGHVRNEAGEGLPNATILLIANGDTVNAITDKKGAFNVELSTPLTGAKGMTLEIRTTMRGFKEFRAALFIKPEQSAFIIPPIILSVAYEDLIPVMILSIKPITILTDTVEYHAGAYKLRPGDELQRLMKRLPGIDWDTAGNIIIDGKRVSRLMINGQDFTVGDIKLALQKLPADIIDKVQIIDDYGDKARLTGVKSGESEKVMNVVLKQDKRNGNVSNVALGIGDKRRYNENLFSDFFNNDRQITVNGTLANLSPSEDLREYKFEMGYADKWNPHWTNNATLSFWGDNHESSNSMVQDTYFPNYWLHQGQDNEMHGNNRNEMVSISQKYVPDDNTQLRIGGFIGLYHNGESVTNNFDDNEQDTSASKIESGYTKNQSQSNGKVVGSNLYFEKKNPNNGQRFSLDASYRLNYTKGIDDESSNSKIAENTLTNTTLEYYKIKSLNITKEINIQPNYYFTLISKSLVEIGYGWNYKAIQNDLTTQKPDSANSNLITIDSLSNNYFYTTIYNRVHAGYLLHFKTFVFSFVLNAQNEDQKGQSIGKESQQTYRAFAVLPIAEISGALSTRQRITFSYHTSLALPSLQQIQPLLNISNPQYPIQGNPNLKPAYEQSVNLTYELSSKIAKQSWHFSAEAIFNTTRQMVIANVTHPIDSSAVIQRTTFVNADGFYSISGNYRLTFPAFLHHHLKIIASGGISQTQGLFMTDNVLYHEGSEFFNQGLQISLLIPNIVETDLSAGYSYSINHYAGQNVEPGAYPGFAWAFRSRHELLEKWTLDYAINQGFTTSNNRLQPVPAAVSASIQWDIFKGNQARISFGINNLLNNTAGVIQSIDPTGQTIIKTNLVGRYYFFSITGKLESFKTSKVRK